MAVYPGPAEHYASGVARIGDCYKWDTEPVHTESNLKHERDWSVNQFLNRKSPHNLIERDTTEVVAIEAPATSSAATSTERRQAKDTPLAE